MTDEYKIEQIENGWTLELNLTHATLGTPSDRKLFFSSKADAIGYLIDELSAQIGKQ